MADAKKICSSIEFTCFAGFLLRICLIVYGEWQDKTMAVKYTDIDYHVFTDAARHVVEGNSPYLRSTYRYTPLLSILLTPNITLHMCFGKLIFVIFDVLAGYLLYRIAGVQGRSDRRAVMASWLWLFNPLPLTVSTRGNAESIMAVLVLASVYFALIKHVSASATFFALSVHFKIFPIIYGLPLVLLVGDDALNAQKPDVGRTEDNHKGAGYIHRAVKFILHPQRVKFAMISAVTFLGLTGLLYARYGFEFLEHTYLYHVTRRDVKHNFSVYFYMMYLVEGSQWASVLGLASFIPQLILTVTFGMVYYRDLPFCCFVQTFAFVMFNKVCTSQYFLWYLSLLPLIMDSVNISLKQVIVLTASWFSSQVFGKKLYYNRADDKFNIDPPPPRTCYHVLPNRVKKWVRRERMRFFWKTDLFLEYKLCVQLHNAADSSSTSVDLHEARTFLGTLEDMCKFQIFLRNTAGHKILCYWIDAERYRCVTKKEHRRFAYREIQAKYLQSGSPKELPESLTFMSVCGPTTSFKLLKYGTEQMHPSGLSIFSENIFIPGQKMALQRLSSYWLPKFIQHKKIIRKLIAEKRGAQSEFSAERRLTPVPEPEKDNPVSRTSSEQEIDNFMDAQCVSSTESVNDEEIRVRKLEEWRRWFWEGTDSPAGSETKIEPPDDMPLELRQLGGVNTGNYSSLRTCPINIAVKVS